MYVLTHLYNTEWGHNVIILDSRDVLVTLMAKILLPTACLTLTLIGIYLL